MKIYFVNTLSKTKGPFDIVDIDHQNILDIGDICVRETHCGVELLLIVSPINKWEMCKLIGKSDCHSGIEGNTLLFAYDGISSRYGNKKVIAEIFKMFNEPAIIRLGEDVIRILSFDADFFDCETIQNIYRLPDKVVTTVQPIKSAEVSQKNQYDSIPMFSNYLVGEAFSYLLELHSHGMSTKDAYIKVRARYSQEFRKALVNFLKDHPNATIYDT